MHKRLYPSYSFSKMLKRSKIKDRRMSCNNIPTSSRETSCLRELPQGTTWNTRNNISPISRRVANNSMTTFNGHKLAVVQIQSLVEAAGDEYHKSKLKFRGEFLHRTHLELHQTSNAVVYNIKDGFIADWLVGKSRVQSRIIFPAVGTPTNNLSCYSLANNNSRSVIKSNYSVYNMGN